ncbi:unnamed protein product [Paramecium primaurelia]|uniref:Transmembrane protein n=1 Tax=Paramecium primaurelia TaxID=5886 RepID=A0A8S1QPG9_PARPR|nr:unnamed protein product [Paramecium primaurelia]
MIIFLITSALASHIYPIKQNPKTFAFQLAYQQGSLTLDLNSQLTYMKLRGQEVKCNSSPFGDEVECSYCTPNCVLEDASTMCYKNNKQKRCYTFLQIKRKYQVQDNREDQLNIHRILLFPIFFIYTLVLIKDLYQKSLRIHISIKQITNQILPLNIKQLKYKIKQLLIQQLSLHLLIILTYFSKFQVVEESYNLIVKNQSLKLPDIEFIFDDDEKIIMESESYILQLQNDTHILRFNSSKLNRIELGLPFLAQKLMTIDSNTQKFYFSDFNCQDLFEQIQLEVDYFKQILLPTLLICLVFYCILTQKAKIQKQSRTNESYELTKLKQEIDEDEEI